MYKYLLSLVCFLGTLQANEVIITHPDGDEILFSDINDADELQDKIESYFGVPIRNQRVFLGEMEPEEDPLKTDFKACLVRDQRKVKMSSTLIPRDFDAEVTESEFKDIKYIVTTLANKPTPKLLFHKSSLDSAGDRVNHIHPLRFLAVIFTDEEMKVSMHNMSKKSWVWKEFIKGLSDSLSEEKGRQNLNLDQIEEFAAMVELESSKYIKSIDQSRWEEFVQIMIKLIPRKGDHDKYNMYIAY